MTIDERLEKLVERHEALTERHEALTERHEALTARHEALTKRHEALTERHEALAQTVELLTIETRINAELGREVTRSVLDLVTVMRSHESRLTNLEGNA